jgi:hypothetical protein
MNSKAPMSTLWFVTGLILLSILFLFLILATCRRTEKQPASPVGQVHPQKILHYPPMPEQSVQPAEEPLYVPSTHNKPEGTNDILL